MLSKLAIVAIILMLLWGLEQVVVSPLETGAAYPEYSSMRPDPMGAMALYESLARVTKVERLYKSRTQIESGPGTTFFILGVDPVAWSKLEEPTLKEYEKLTGGGARLVIAFLPVPGFGGKTDPEVEARWHVRFTGKLLKGGTEWKVIDPQANAIERPLGAGSVALVGNSYPLSNEGLRETHDARLLVKLAGNASKIVFDENHFGVIETGSIAKLMRKYHLEGALAVLGLVAALFLWRSASSLLPSRAPRAEQAVTGRDSLEGMTALLRRGIGEKDLLRTCCEEYKRASKVDLKMPDHKNVVAAYREIAKGLAEKS